MQRKIKFEMSKKRPYDLNAGKHDEANEPVISYPSVQDHTSVTFEQEWKRGMTVDQFHSECVERLKRLYGKI